MTSFGVSRITSFGIATLEVPAIPTAIEPALDQLETLVESVLIRKQVSTYPWR